MEPTQSAWNRIAWICSKRRDKDNSKHPITALWKKIANPWITNACTQTHSRRPHTILKNWPRHKHHKLGQSKQTIYIAVAPRTSGWHSRCRSQTCTRIYQGMLTSRILPEWNGICYQATSLMPKAQIYLKTNLIISLNLIQILFRI